MIMIEHWNPWNLYLKQENQGVARTLNNGIKICKGKYIRRHDADDLSTPSSLKEQVDFIEKNSEVGLVSSRQVYMTENNKVAPNKFNYAGFEFKEMIEIIEAFENDFKKNSGVDW